MGPNQQRGTSLGALTGGMLGAAVGSGQGKGAEGALIGAVAGAATGNIVGDAADQEIEQARYEQQLATERAYLAALSFEQLIQMHASGLGEDVIIRQIQTQGLRQPTRTDDLIFLRSSGLPDAVLLACQSASLQSGPSREVRVVPACEVVYPVVPCPAVRFPPPYRRFYHEHPPAMGIHIGF